MKRKLIPVGLVVGLALVTAACSSSGGKKAQQTTQQASTGKATTAHMTFAMVTHEAPGDTFWDVIRKGAQAAAAKDNVTLRYSNDPTSSSQANLIGAAVDSKVDGLATTIPDPPAISPAVKKAIAAGIPVVGFNAGADAWQQAGALMYFGQDEHLAGESAGKRASADGFKHVLCVIQEQGQVQLEARCSGVQSTFGGSYTKLYVNGRDTPSVRTTISAKMKQDPSIDFVITLGAPIALAAIDAIKDAGSKAKLGTFDFNTQIPGKIKAGDLTWAIDQQPFVQGYMAIDSLWLLKTNGDTIGGGKVVQTGPYFVDKTNVEAISGFAAKGTR